MRRVVMEYPYWVLSLVAVAATLVLYLPGLSGTFLLDDFYSLEPIGHLGGINSLEKLNQYIFSGNTGPGGRPIPLLTFVLNSQHWPAEPYFFILTNILLHVLNGILVFALLKKLLENRSVETSAPQFIAMLGAALWVLHPAQVSTVLYVVQRMTILSATFSLVALVVYLYSREAYITARARRAVVLLIFAALAAAAAFFSKENAVLLPLQVLILEIFLRLKGERAGRLHKALFWGCVIPAAIIVVAYPLKLLTVHTLEFFATGVDLAYGRDFTLYERLLTQQRVLGDYIIATVVPRMQSAGIFHDGYEISRGLFSPLSTGIWLAFHGAALCLACLVRRRSPIIFLGVFWFYGSHFLESSVIMLELKFEHRNYLPSLGIVLLIAYSISLLAKQLRFAVAGVAVIIYSFCLLMASSLWGSPQTAAIVWARENPGSLRALENAARQQIRSDGDLSVAKGFMKEAVLLSGRPTTELRYITAFCATYDGNDVDWLGLAQRLKTEPRDWTLYSTLRDLISNRVNGSCELFDLMGYRALLAAYRKNAAYKGNLSALLMDEYEILALLDSGEVGEAINFERSLMGRLYPLAYSMKRAGLFASFGQQAFAAEMLSHRLAIAEQLRNEDQFTLQNAAEMLELIRLDVE